LAGIGDRRNIQSGCSLFRAGDRGPHLYVIKRGLFEVFLQKDAGLCPVASFLPGASFVYDFCRFNVARCEAVEASEAIDIPLDRLNRLAREGIELRLLLYWCRSFDLRAFIDACYPE
jgi:CRP-like cAMP-binding protein